MIQPPTPRVIKASNVKTFGYLLLCLGFTACGWWMVQDPEVAAWKGWLCVVFFAACSLAFLASAVRPHRLELDAKGFSIVGGLTRRPAKTAWRDMQGFFVYRLPRGGKMIGFNYAAGDSRAVHSIWKRGSSAQSGLPSGWPGSPEKLVEDLNAYRRQALEAEGARWTSF